MVNAKHTSSGDGLPSQPTDRFRFLAELIPQLVWITDPTGYHTYFNQRWIDFTGYTLADSVGPDMWNNLLHPDDRQRARVRWEHSLRTGEFYEIEYRFLSKDGSYRWFLGQALPQRDANGQIEEWFGTCTYIEDQKQAQLELARVSQDFTTLANTIPQLAWMASAEGELTWFNERWHDYTGFTLEAIRQDWRQVHHPEHLQRVIEGLTHSYHSGEPWEDTFPIRSKTGEYRWFLSRAVPMRNNLGQIIRWCGTHTDITEQKKLQDQLERSYADLEVKVTFRTLELEREVQELRQQQEK